MKKRNNFTFGIIGCGNIGIAIIKALTEFADISRDKICVSDIDKSKTKILKKNFGIVTTDTDILVRRSRFVIIAVKPKDIAQLCSSISPYLKKNSIIISVAAGITIDSIRKMLDKDVSAIRFMPNLAIGYGNGLIAYCSNGVTSTTIKKIVRIFSKAAYCFPVKEKDMFFMTAVAGSAPGFLFYLAELVYKILRKRRFSDNISVKIVSHLFQGAGIMLAKAEENPALLKEKVCSPGGTTLAGLSKLTEGNLEKTISAAFESAEKKAIELSKLR